MSSLSIIQQLMIEEFGLEASQVGSDAKLEELGVDSLATIEFMFLLEDKFKLRMSDNPVAVKTVGDIAREIDLLLAQQAVAPPPPSKS
jgi:acyl carrier protein